jgi:hypothetical protein
MQEKIDGIIYDTHTASLLADVEKHTFHAGMSRTRIYRTHQGDWFCTIVPTHKKMGSNVFKEELLKPHEAKEWLESKGFILLARAHFGTGIRRVDPEKDYPQKIASWHEKTWPMNPGGRLFEELCFEPARGWVLKSKYSEGVVPLSNDEVENLIIDLR